MLDGEILDPIRPPSSSAVTTAFDVAEPMKRRGRRPGSKNRRTVEIETLLRPMVPKARKRLLAMLKSPDDDLAFRASVMVFSYVYGRPSERREVGGAADATPSSRESRIPSVVAVLATLLPSTENGELFKLAGQLIDRMHGAPATISPLSPGAQQ